MRKLVRGRAGFLYAEHIPTTGKDLYQIIYREDLEGIVAKHKLAPYSRTPQTRFKILTKITKVNIIAFCATAKDGEGAVHAVVDNVNKAKKALERAGLSYTESDVLYVELSNAIGSLGKFAEKLAVQEINVTSAYATAAKGCHPSSSTKRALKLKSLRY